VLWTKEGQGEQKSELPPIKRQRPVACQRDSTVQRMCHASSTVSPKVCVTHGKIFWKLNCNLSLVVPQTNDHFGRCATTTHLNEDFVEGAKAEADATMAATQNAVFIVLETVDLATTSSFVASLANKRHHSHAVYDVWELSHPFLKQMKFHIPQEKI
jgi:hypothetical protein